MDPPWSASGLPGTPSRVTADDIVRSPGASFVGNASLQHTGRRRKHSSDIHIVL